MLASFLDGPPDLNCHGRYHAHGEENRNPVGPGAKDRPVPDTQSWLRRGRLVPADLVQGPTGREPSLLGGTGGPRGPLAGGA